MTVSAKYTKTHNAILDAAARCYGRLGVEKTSMMDIAEEASVGRTTLYRHFSNQDEVLVEAVVRDIYDVLDQLTQCINAQPLLEDKIIEGMLFCIEAFSSRPVLGMLLNPESATLLVKMGMNAEQLLNASREFTQPIYDLAQAQQRLREDVSLNEYIDWLSRILISLRTMPGAYDGNPDKTRAFLRKFLIPSVLS